MWKRRRTWLLLAALIGIALAGYFEPSHCVRGWLWGEAFFDGRPTSYWRNAILRDLNADGPPLEAGVFHEWQGRPLKWWERWRVWLGHVPGEVISAPILSADARSVLQALADDADADLAGFAADALGILEGPDFQRGGFPAQTEDGRLWPLARHGLLILKNSKNPKARDFGCALEKNATNR